ncbi:acyl-CoA thioesterase [Mesohalobacter halotolerans]|uniref:Acyl-CoA thioesterase n=1 Tax=Mesohalobacter halotolerans TaxID=1883405 RepID=A0A4U5TTG9_9FLAO|nr:acyl-CoA thioesterase [Mesohalobacter halotolerans]MBS3738406.1 acyl-CoA thioesterase [Psychroflexus sp.]TKS57352.1 acyl-CoA thioesterase [Mesohalobacter halotolerans]
MSFTKEFEVRWSDLDANRHLANSAYQNMMSHTRMAFLLENGFTQKELVKYNLGPVVFYEHIYYFKEIRPDDKIEVSLKLKGLSNDGTFFAFEHDFYNAKGKNCARCEMLGSWIDLKSRTLKGLPQHLLKPLDNLAKTDDFKVLTKADTRKYKVFPKDKS